MQDAARQWAELDPVEKLPFSAACDEHVVQRSHIVAEKVKHLQNVAAALHADAERVLQEQGLPNLMSAAEKLSDESLEELGELLLAPASLALASDAYSTSPVEPSIPETNELQRLNFALAPQSPDDGPRPWWVRHVAHNRDDWYGCAIFDEDAEDDKIYLMLFASKSPQFVWFLECREKDRVIEVGGCMLDDHVDLPPSYREFEFLEPLVVLPDHRIPIAEDASIGVHVQMIFRGPLLCAFHEPVSFEDFVGPLSDVPAAVAQPRAAPQRVRARNAVDRLLEEHDWLTRDDLVDEKEWHPPRRRKRQCSRPASTDVELEAEGSDSASQNSEEEPPGGHDPELGVDAVHDAEDLEAIREEVRLHLDEQPDLYFRVVTRGGEWTLEHTGHAADSNRGEARGQFVKEWATKYGWPKTMTFSMLRYGREGSARLAKEFCRRSTYFFLRCFESPSPATYTYTQADVDACPEDLKFLDFVLEREADDPVLLRAIEVRALSPRLGPLLDMAPV